MNRVTVISVTYNSSQVIGGMLESIPLGVPIIIIDNASRDSSILVNLADAKDTKIILNHENVGFGSACNQGAAMASTEFLLFLNPDAQLDPKTIDHLCNAADQYPDAVAFNPRFQDSAGQPNFKRSCRLLPRRKWMAKGWPVSDTKVNVLSGAALFVRKVDFEAVSGFDEKIFLFFEDDDLSLRLTARGNLMFVRDALVTHIGAAASTSDARITKVKAWHWGWSRIYASRKHGIRGAYAGLLVSAILRALSPWVLLSSTFRAERWAYLKGATHAYLQRTKP